MKKQGLKDLILDGMRYLVIALFWLGFMMAGLWCVSCTTPRDIIVVSPHLEDFDFDIDDVVWYDADRNVCGYVVLDTVKSVHNGKTYIVGYTSDTIELHLNGVLFEELEQGEAAWVSEGIVLYD